MKGLKVYLHHIKLSVLKQENNAMETIIVICSQGVITDRHETKLVPDIYFWRNAVGR